EVKGGSFGLVERGGGIVERAVKSAAAAVLTQQFSRIRALNPPQPRFKEKPRLPKRAGLELDRVRPLKSPVSPSAPTRNVAFGSAPDMQRNGHPSFGQTRPTPRPPPRSIIASRSAVFLGVFGRFLACT